MSQDKSRRTLSVQAAKPATGRAKKPLRTSGLNRDRVHQAAETAKAVREKHQTRRGDDRRSPHQTGPYSVSRDATPITQGQQGQGGGFRGRPSEGAQGGFRGRPAEGGARGGFSGRDGNRDGARDGNRRPQPAGGFTQRGEGGQERRPPHQGFRHQGGEGGFGEGFNRNAPRRPAPEGAPRRFGDDRGGDRGDRGNFSREGQPFRGGQDRNRFAGRDERVVAVERGAYSERPQRDRNASSPRPYDQNSSFRGQDARQTPYQRNERDANAQTVNRPAPRRWDNGDAAEPTRYDAPRPRYGDRDNAAPRTPRPEGFRSEPRGQDPRGGNRFEGRPPRDFNAPRPAYGERDTARPARDNDAPRPRYGDRDNAAPRAPRPEGFRSEPRGFEPRSGGRFDDRPPRQDRGASAPRYGQTPNPATPTGERPVRLGHRFDPRGDAPVTRNPEGVQRFGRPIERAEAPQPLHPATPRPVTASRVDADGTMRLSKRMSELGLCSRREADEWIEQGLVMVDGKRITELGSRIHPDARIEVSPQAQKQQALRVTVLLHKPVGYVSGQAEDGYEPAVNLFTAENQWEGDGTLHDNRHFHPSQLRNLAPAGRLDIDSTGLLVLTQDGRIAKQLIGEDSLIEKEYLVRVAYPTPEGVLEQDIAPIFPEEMMELLRHGLELDGEALKPAKVSWQNGEQLRVVLREGKKRQIRRMCELVGLHVVGLKRVRMGRIPLGHLPVGKWRFLRWDEKF